MKKLFSLILLFAITCVHSQTGVTPLNLWKTNGNSVSTNTAFIGTTSNRSLLLKTNNVQRLKVDSLGILKLSSNTNTTNVGGSFWYYSSSGTGTAAPTGFNFYVPTTTYWEKAATFKNQYTGIHIQLSNYSSSMAGWLKPVMNQGIGMQDSSGNTGIRVDPGGRVIVSPGVTGTNVANFAVIGTMSVSGTSTLSGQTISQDRIRFVTNVVFTPSLSGSIYKSQDHGLAFHGTSGGTNDFIIATPAGQAILKNPTGSNNVILAESGKVRIGQNSIPSANLDVTGTMSVSSTSTLGGDLYMNGGNRQIFGSNALTLDATAIYFNVPTGATIGAIHSVYSAFSRPMRIGNQVTPSATLDVAGTMSVSSNASLSTIYFPTTQTGSLTGIVYKNGNRFLHDFKSSTTTGQNVFLGELAGNLTLTGAVSATEGSYNAAVGYQSGQALTTGNFNTFVGHASGAGCTTCGFNVAIGRLAGGGLAAGQGNIYIGEQTGGSNVNSQNVVMGQRALFSATNVIGSTGIGFASLQNTQGHYNIALGYAALQDNITGASNVSIGNYSGKGIKYQSNKLYIDNQSRTDSTGAVTKSLIYGVFGATAATQSLSVNGSLFANQGAAVSSTLTVGNTSTLTGGNSGTLAVLSDAVFPITFNHGYYTPPDGSTGYLGNTPLPPHGGGSNTGTITLPYNCTLVGWNYNAVPSVAVGSAGSTTMSINGTTNYTLSTAINYTLSGQNGFSGTGLSQDFNSGDTFNIKFVNPTWATNPDGIFGGITLWFVRRK